MKKGLYILLEWVEGKPAEAYIPYIPKKQAYEYGKDAGRTLKKIHSIPLAGKHQIEIDYESKIRRKISIFRNVSLPIIYKNLIIDFMLSHWDEIGDLTPCYIHGDYHIGNMLLNDNQLITIDYDRSEVNIPYDDF